MEKLPEFERKLGEYREEAPTIQDLEQIKNPISNYQTVIKNLFDSCLFSVKKRQSPYPAVLKAALMLPALSDQNMDFSHASAWDMISKIDEQEREKFRHYDNSKEVVLNKEAIDFIDTLPSTEGAVHSEKKYFKAPLILDSSTGPILTNIYEHKPEESLPTPIPEEKTYRINIAVEGIISAYRVWADLYKQLCREDSLARYGFISKGRSGNITDNVIIYCGPKAFQGALQVVGDYCVKERVGREVNGVPFGIKPIAEGEYDQKGYKGISITADQKGSTFNEVQAQALCRTFDALYEKLKDDLAFELQQWKPDFVRLLEICYRRSLEEMGVTPNLHNVAFSRLE